MVGYPAENDCAIETVCLRLFFGKRLKDPVRRRAAACDGRAEVLLEECSRGRPRYT